jgi:hypothetical protein
MVICAQDGRPLHHLAALAQNNKEYAQPHNQQ